MSIRALASAKMEYLEKGTSTAALQWIMNAADSYLKKKPVSVMMKTGVPPSGDKHDFMSLNPNIWPDPENSGKYVYKDGAWNADNDFIPQFADRGHFNTLKKWVSTLAIAYALSGREAYAQKASHLLRFWFITPETRMNPNLNYAYAWPGKESQETGWASGIMELQSLYMLFDSVVLLEDSPFWTKNDRSAMKSWAFELLAWLNGSTFGRVHAESKGNHGTYHDVFRATLAYFIGDYSQVRTIVEEAKKRRVEAQIAPDGSMPGELVRATSLHYSIYNIEALFYLALIAEKVDIDLWRFETTDGRGIKRALDYVAEAGIGTKGWPFPQNKPYDPYQMFTFILEIAESRYKTGRYAALLTYLDSKKFAEADPRLHLVFP